ncbi:MAG: hypothetical protein ACM3ZC_15995 [Bacteroidota bacterium]
MQTVSCITRSVTPRTKVELFKLLKVLAEVQVQSIIPVEVQVPKCPDRLIDVNITTANETFHVFTGKLVKQGTLVVTIEFCDEDDDERCFTTTVPFMAVVEATGLCPDRDVDIQFKNVLIENDLQLVHGVLTGKVHLVEQVKVSEFVQRFLEVQDMPVTVTGVVRQTPPVKTICGRVH